MKKLILLGTLLVKLPAQYAQSCDNNNLEQVLQLAEKQTNNVLIDFNYTNENLINILNQLASKQGINLLLPIELQKLDFEITLNVSEQITLTKAWGIVNTFLEISGFTLVPRGLTYEISLTKDANREALNTYVNIHPELLPDNEERIRYLYYLQNINLSSPTSKSRANLEVILKDMLGTDAFIIDQKSNCLILTNRTSNIKSAMNIIIALDQEGFREVIEIVPLKYTNAKVTTDLINKMIDIKKTGGARYPTGSDNKAGEDEEVYFSKNTSIVPIDRNNAVVIMGTGSSVSKVKNFILKYLDIPVDTGKSIIHVKELQHIDAGELSEVLQKIIRSKAEQMQASSRKDALNDVIITAEKTKNTEQIKQLEVKSDKDQVSKVEPIKRERQMAFMGSNNLIIAAREPEWQILEQLIDEIDQPQTQVAVEGLIVDLYISDLGIVSSQTRNLAPSGNPQNFNFQSAQIGGPVLNYTQSTSGSTTTYTPTPQGLASDLLTAGQAVTTNSTTSITNFLYELAYTGSTLISFSDGNGIASLLGLFKGYENIKVLSEPFLTTTNHQQAAILSSVHRIVQGDVKQQSVGGPVIVQQADIKADVELNVLPRISSSGEINLEVIVRVDQFSSLDDTNNTILRRKIQTSANLTDKQILVIGGLTQILDTDIISQVPILSKVPIVGNFFKSRRQSSTRRNLMVFLSPKIIKPRAGINKFTRNKIDQAIGQISDLELPFSNLADPVTNILFSLQAPNESKAIQDFTTKANTAATVHKACSGAILKSVSN